MLRQATGGDPQCCGDDSESLKAGQQEQPSLQRSTIRTHLLRHSTIYSLFLRNIGLSGQRASEKQRIRRKKMIIRRREEVPGRPQAPVEADAKGVPDGPKSCV